MKKYGGIIRFKFVIPLAIACGAIFLYTVLFLDQHLRWIAAKYATQLNGAEVNIGSVRTSISGLSLELQKVQLTDPDRPTHNRLEIGKVRFDLGTMGLIQSKFIIEDASVHDIRMSSERRKPGYVLPPPPPAPGLKEQAVELLKPIPQELMTNAMSVLEEKGLKNPLEGIKWEELPSAQALSALNVAWQQKQQTLQQTIDSLPKASELNQLKAEISALKTPQTVEQVKETLAKVDAIKKRTEQDVAKVKAAAKTLQTEGDDFTKQVKNLGSAVNQDVALLSQRLKLPDLDFKELPEEIAGPIVKRYVGILEGYYGRIKPYIESDERKVPSRPLRYAGTNFTFPVRNGLPAFWLKNMQISSKETADGPLADMLGKLTNLSSTPALVAAPTRFSFEGSFRGAGIEGLKGDVTLDHRSVLARDEFKLAIARFPVDERILASSKDFSIKYGKAFGSTNMAFMLQGEKAQLSIETRIRELTWQIDAVNERVKNLLTTSLLPLKEFSIDATAEGPFSQLNWQFSSNVADQLRIGLRQALARQLTELQDRLKAELDKRLTAEQAKLEAEMKKQLQGYEEQVALLLQLATDNEAAVEKIKAEINKQVDAKKAELEQKVEAEKNKALEKQEEKLKEQLKGKLKIPGLGK
jgi:uncharacterized protein (TIGR03545 family)